MSNLGMSADAQPTLRPQSNRAKPTSKYVGVTFKKETGQWVAQGRINGKKVHFGYYDSEWDAGCAWTVKQRDRAPTRDATSSDNDAPIRCEKKRRLQSDDDSSPDAPSSDDDASGEGGLLSDDDDSAENGPTDDGLAANGPADSSKESVERRHKQLVQQLLDKCAVHDVQSVKLLLLKMRECLVAESKIALIGAQAASFRAGMNRKRFGSTPTHTNSGCTHTHLHTCTHARTHARTHAHTHAHVHTCVRMVTSGKAMNWSTKTS